MRWPPRDVGASSQTYQSRLILILPCHLLTDFEASNLWGKKTKAIQYSNGAVVYKLLIKVNNPRSFKPYLSSSEYGQQNSGLNGNIPTLTSSMLVQRFIS